MLLDMFSSLDYMYSSFEFLKSMSFSWFMVILICLMFLKSYYVVMKNFLMKGFFSGAWLSEKKGQVGMFWVLSSLFVYIFFQNLLGLFPYTFSITSHIVSNFFLAFEMWVSIIFLGIFGKLLSFISHFSPFGSPLVLSKFLNLMEVVSVMIRSLTLSLRLSVKMSTGHIFLGLVSSWLLICGSSIVWGFSFVCFVGYFFFELFVCFIQALVFNLLLVQYLDEQK